MSKWPYHPRQHLQTVIRGTAIEVFAALPVAAPGREHAALECRRYMTEIGRTRIILRCVVAIYVEDRFVDPAGPYIEADELHAIGRMDGLGNYVRTRNALMWRKTTSRTAWLSGEVAEVWPHCLWRVLQSFLRSGEFVITNCPEFTARGPTPAPGVTNYVFRWFQILALPMRVAPHALQSSTCPT